MHKRVYIVATKEGFKKFPSGTKALAYAEKKPHRRLVVNATDLETVPVDMECKVKGCKEKWCNG